MVGIRGIETKTEITHTFEMMNRMIRIFHEESDRCVTGLSPLVLCPVPGHTALPEMYRGGLSPLSLLEEWGDFDQFDFHTPWVSDECYKLTNEFRENLPCNSGIVTMGGGCYRCEVGSSLG